MKSLLNKLATFISERFNINVDNVNKYASNTLWLLLDYAFSLIVGFVVMILVARYLGPTSYGIISFALVLYAIALDFMTLGIDDLIVRQAIRYKNSGEEQDIPAIFSTAFFARNMAMILILIILFAYIYFVYNGEGFSVLIVILSAMLIRPLDILNLFFQMKVEMKYVSISKMIGYFVSAFLKIIFIIFKMPLIYFAFAIFFETVFAISFLIFFYLKNGYSFSGWKVNFSILKYYIKNGWALFFTKLFSILQLKANVIIIQYLMLNRDIGIYSSASRLVEILYIFPKLIGDSVFPAIVRAHQKGNDIFNVRVGQLLSLVMWGFILIAIIVTFFSDFIINLIYGAAYNEGSSILAILIWSLPLYMFFIITTKYLLMNNNMIACLWRSLLNLLLLVIFSFLFFEKYGLQGFAYSILLSFLISYFLIDIIFVKRRKLFIIKCKATFIPFFFYNKNKESR